MRLRNNRLAVLAFHRFLDWPLLTAYFILHKLVQSVEIVHIRKQLGFNIIYLLVRYPRYMWGLASEWLLFLLVIMMCVC